MKNIEINTQNTSNQESIDRVRVKLFEQMAQYEAAIDGIETPEQTEALNQRLSASGSVIHFRRKKKIYFLVAAVIIMVMAMGSVGVGSKFQKLKVDNKDFGDDSMTVVNSDDDIMTVSEVNQEKVAYDEIEQVLGIPAMRLMPDGCDIEYLEHNVSYSTKAEVIYDYEGTVLIYTIGLKQDSVSHQEVVEDASFDSYILINGDVEIHVKEYPKEKTGVGVMEAQYSSNNIYYSIKAQTKRDIFENLLNNLYFY